MKFNRKIYETRNEKQKDFVIGFFGWIVVNVIAVIVGSAVFNAVLSLFERLFPGASYDTIMGIQSIGSLLMPLLFNVGLLIFLALTRKWIALGALAGFAAVLIFVVVAGLVLTAICASMY